MKKILTPLFFARSVLLLLRLGLLVAVLLLGLSVYQSLIQKFFDPEASQTVFFILLWLFTAYIVLPRVHRLLTKFYLPNYFIGRARTANGLLGDPTNIALIGTRTQLIKAMEAAGWQIADPITWQTSLRAVKSAVLRQSYPTAPVSNLYLFSRKQDLAFQIELGSSHQRHHVRFWATPKPWWLPGGAKVDWLGAATHDHSIGLSGFTLQITHKIVEDVDEERDFVVNTLQDANRIKSLKVIKHFSSAFHDRNGGGDMIKTDGALPIITLV